MKAHEATEKLTEILLESSFKFLFPLQFFSILLVENLHQRSNLFFNDLQRLQT